MAYSILMTFFLQKILTDFYQYVALHFKNQDTSSYFERCLVEFRCKNFIFFERSFAKKRR
jgi:hypothetical protein